MVSSIKPTLTMNEGESRDGRVREREHRPWNGWRRAGPGKSGASPRCQWRLDREIDRWRSAVGEFAEHGSTAQIPQSCLRSTVNKRTGKMITSSTARDLCLRRQKPGPCGDRWCTLESILWKSNVYLCRIFALSSGNLTYAQGSTSITMSILRSTQGSWSDPG